MTRTKMPASNQVGVGSLMVLALACGQAADERVDPRTSPAATAQAATPAEGGSLTLGERTMTFRVLSCDLSEPPSPDVDTMRGTGQSADGKRFTVVVARGGGNTQIHQVALTSGDIMSGAGYQALSMRSRVQGGGWPADRRNVGPAGPLIRIDGRAVRAEATFQVDSAGTESQVPGRLEAACP